MKYLFSSFVILVLLGVSQLCLALPDPEITALRNKLDKLENIKVHYQLHNKSKGETRDIYLSIRNFRTFRLELEGLTYIVNDGKMLAYNTTRGNSSDIKAVQEEYMQKTDAFWTENAVTLAEIFGAESQSLQQSMQQNFVYSSLLMRVTRSSSYRPSQPLFSISVSAGLVTNESYYSWLGDMENLCQEPGINLNVYEAFLAVKTPSVEFWTSKDTGLLYSQKLMANKKVEASLVCKQVELNQIFDDSLFSVTAPEGVAMTEMSAVQKNSLFIDMQSRFFDKLGGQLAKIGFASLPAPKKDKIKKLIEHWLLINFEVFTPQASRQERVDELLKSFKGAVTAIIEANGDDVGKSRIDIFLLQADTLKSVGATKQDLDSEIRMPMSMQIKNSLKQNPDLADDKWRAIYRVMNSALTKAFRYTYEEQYIDLLVADIKKVSKDFKKQLEKK